MPPEARKLRLVAMTKNRKNPAYVGARLGADRVAARHGCVLTHAVPDKPDDIASSMRCCVPCTRSGPMPC